MKSFAFFAGFAVALAAVPGAISGEKSQEQAKVPADVATLVAGNNEFALNLYQRLSQKKGNIVFSPYSISTALAMTYGGARGTTAEEMANTLRFRLPPERLHAACGQLMDDMQKADKERAYELHVANALWGQRDLPFELDFLQLTLNNYRGGFLAVDYAEDPEAARLLINEWVEQKTKEKIKELLKPEQVTTDTALVLTNAIYFKAAWESPFAKPATKDDDFKLSDGTDAKVPMMNRLLYSKCIESNNCQLLELRYKSGELSLLALLPKKAVGLRELETKLSAPMLIEMAERLAKSNVTEVDVTLPKFQATVDFELGKALQTLGMKAAFSENADFSAIVPRDKAALAISEVIHKAFIDIDEAGTEAAAATAVILAHPSSFTLPSAKPPPIIFRADHPFLFIIRDNRTGSVLFIGRVDDPRKQ